ncbi:MAG: (d)CMP kinase [Phycisphaerae bacterium]
MIITIDGPAGSGKSAAAELLAQRMQVRHLDTGAMYRAVTLLAFNMGRLDQHSDAAELGAIVTHMNLTFDWNTHPAKIMLDGQDVSNAIRQPEITALVQLAADNTAVRAELVRRQRSIAAACRDLVTEGRDQGTLVFPDADYKFFLDANIRERVRRRLTELTRKGLSIDERSLLADMMARDQRDHDRRVGALKLAEDAIVLDTTTMTLPEVVDALVKRIGNKTHG